jgi:hypothetical protein
MAQVTFGEIWNKVLLYAPNLPVPLAQTFVKNAYNKALRAHYWSELFQEGEITIASEVTSGTAAVVNGSASVTLSGGAGLAAWVTMQFGTLTNNGYAPYYDITGVVTATGVLTLDRAYQGATNAVAEYIIAQFFVEFPSDLQALDDIRDATRAWRLRRQYNQPNYLDRIDARRAYAGTPILYVPATPRVAAGVSIPRYEFWPRIPSGTKLVYRYVKKTPLSANTDYPVESLKSEVLVWGALAELTLWPGTPERKNPFFSIDLHREYDTLFEKGLQESILNDEDRAQRMITYAEDDRGYPADARFIQEHGLA